MQNAYASHQFTQLMGRFSRPAGAAVHVLAAPHDVRFATVGARLPSSAATHPFSCATPASPPTSVRPSPPPRCVCLPAPSVGRQPVPPSPASTALTNWRKRPTVTSYLSSRKSLTVAGSVPGFGDASPAPL